jgi:hypothetical protein
MIFARCGLDGPNSDSQFCSNFLVCVSLRQKPNNVYLAWGWLSLLMLSGMRLIFGLEKSFHHDVGYSGAQEQLTSGNVVRGRVLDLRKPMMSVSAIASDGSQAPSSRGAHTQMVSRCPFCLQLLAVVSHNARVCGGEGDTAYSLGPGAGL